MASGFLRSPTAYSTNFLLFVLLQLHPPFWFGHPETHRPKKGSFDSWPSPRRQRGHRLRGLMRCGPPELQLDQGAAAQRAPRDELCMAAGAGKRDGMGSKRELFLFWLLVLIIRKAIWLAKKK